MIIRSNSGSCSRILVQRASTCAVNKAAISATEKGSERFVPVFRCLWHLGVGAGATVKQKVLKSPRKEAVRICLTARNH